MEMLEKKSALETWELCVECTGLFNGDKPCGHHWKVKSEDIVKRRVNVMGECLLDIHGFVCPECNTFTQISDRAIPDVVQHRCTKYYAPPKPAKKSGWRKFFKF